MRRSTLLLGVTVITLVGVGATLYTKGSIVEREREHHVVLIRDNALCEKSLEMAASFSTYNHQNKLTETFVLTNGWLTQSLNIDLRKKAYDLGFTPFEYDAVLQKARFDAEKVLIPQINGSADPAAKAFEIAQTCMPWPVDSHIN